ncbi:MAG TPA: hypothetical protein VFZ59_11995 [Verrucomicrobiae bacterium]|nr:hypothetical protein [Verrucomicrobiae bacterium]
MNLSCNVLLSLIAVRLAILHVMAGNSPTIDPAFTNKFAELKQAAGFVEQAADDSENVWKPNLQLWVGVKAVEGKKQTIYFVQLTTLATPQTNIWGEPWQPTLRTNGFSWTGTNKSAAPKHAEYVNALYPVRARVFDANGQALKEGQTPMAWGMLTNGLLDMCQLSLEIIPRESATNQMPRGLPDEDNDRLMCALGGGFMWMAGMFGDFQTVPPVADVWKKAQCAIRMPSAWSMIKGIFTGFSINLQPRLNEVTLNTPDDGSMPLYRLPLDLKSRKETLTDVEIIIGRARGAEMLMSGIRSIRAVHPSKADREFLAQVLATGSCPEE